METFKNRSIATTSFMGADLRFVDSNDRLQERVDNLSHESYVLRSLVHLSEPDDVFWDIGACLGIHTFVLAKHLTDGSVVGFEPMPANRGVLMDNKSVNQIDNVHISRKALADTPGTKEFAVRQSNHAGYGRHSFDVGDYEKLRSIEVDVARGDDITFEGGTEAEARLPNIVKIDVEGAGPLVIEGMKEILSRDACRAVVFETHEPNPVQPSHEDFGYTREDIISLLESLGFEVESMQNDYHLLARKEGRNSIELGESSLNVSVIQGDIAEQSADAIMNSTGTSLRMGTGVAGALRQAGGESLNEAVLRHGPVEVGDAVVTDAFDLDAEHVVHAASMPHYGTGKSTPQSIQEAVWNALELADDQGCEDIVLPAVGCGLGGVPLSTGSEVIGQVLCEFQPESLEEARFIAYTQDEYETVQMVLGDD